jgi:hypothetical protein
MAKQKPMVTTPAADIERREMPSNPASQADDAPKKRETCIYCHTPMIVASTPPLFQWLKCPSCGATRKVVRRDVTARLTRRPPPTDGPPRP